MPTPALPSGPQIALDGLTTAVRRVKDAFFDGIRHDIRTREIGGPMTIALSEALFWVAALEDAAVKQVNGYFQQRDHDPAGRAIGGLVYARNFHTHELVMAGQVDEKPMPVRPTVTPPGSPRQRRRGTLISIQFEWLDFDDLPPPRVPERYNRDAMYRDHVAARPISHPLDDAANRFQQMLALAP